MNGTDIETVGTMDERNVLELTGGGRITYATMDSAMHGDIEGTCQSTMMILNYEENHAKYHGYQTIVGSVGGRQGTTVFWFEGGNNEGDFVTHFRFLPEFGTDALAGLKGGGTVQVLSDEDAEYTFEYTFHED